jgi:hypothetical protein
MAQAGHDNHQMQRVLGQRFNRVHDGHDRRHQVSRTRNPESKRAFVPKISEALDASADLYHVSTSSRGSGAGCSFDRLTNPVKTFFWNKTVVVEVDTLGSGLRSGFGPSHKVRWTGHFWIEKTKSCA